MKKMYLIECYNSFFGEHREHIQLGVVSDNNLAWYIKKRKEDQIKRIHKLAVYISNRYHDLETISEFECDSWSRASNALQLEDFVHITEVNVLDDIVTIREDKLQQT